MRISMGADEAVPEFVPVPESVVVPVPEFVPVPR
jgi:hypothetical protein